MQVVRTPRGERVVVMQASELLMTEVALSRYVLENPNSNLAVRMLAETSHANEEAESAMEDAAEGSAPA